MERIANLKEKIYLLAYGKPRYKLEISNMLYGKEQKQIYPVINDLIKDNWIEKTDYVLDEKDKRANKRIYYKANIEPLYDNICQDLEKLAKESIEKYPELKVQQGKITLNENEKKKLKKYLRSDYFRKFIFDITKRVDFKNEPKGFDLVKESYSYLCMYQSTMIQYFNERLGIDIMNLKDIEKHPVEVQDLLSKSSVLNLGESLLRKLANLQYERAFEMYRYFYFFVKSVEGINKDEIMFLRKKIEDLEKKVKNKNINGNGHGLS